MQPPCHCLTLVPHARPPPPLSAPVKCGFFVPHWLPTLKKDVAHKLDYFSRTQFVRFFFRLEARVKAHVAAVKQALNGTLDGAYHGIHVCV